MSEFEMHVVGALEALAATMKHTARNWLGGEAAHAEALEHIGALREMVPAATEAGGEEKGGEDADGGGGRGRKKGV